LHDEFKPQLDEPISIQEIPNAILELPKLEAPGSHVYIKFHKQFATILSFTSTA
jgi:hypothetical protein